MEGDETELVARLRARDPHALARLHELHSARLHSFLVRLGADAVLASDLSQETWLRLAATADRLAPDSEPRAWLFTVARNLYRSHRRWRVLSRVREVELTWLAPSESLDPEQREQVQRVERAIASLPDAYREVLLLVAVEGFGADEAARILELSAVAVRKRLSRARALLREHLEER